VASVVVGSSGCPTNVTPAAIAAEAISCSVGGFACGSSPSPSWIVSKVLRKPSFVHESTGASVC
jgi:hypothetical protein